MTARGRLLTGGMALAVCILVVSAILLSSAEPDGSGTGPDRPEPPPSPTADIDPSFWRQGSESDEDGRRPDPPGPQEEVEHTITGTVVLTDGRRLEGVTVVALMGNAPVRSTKTNAEGHFELRGLPREAVRLQVSGISADGDVVLPDSPVPARAGPHEVQLSASPGALIEGRVVGPGGRALANVDVFIGNIHGTYKPTGTPVRTDEEGRFRHVVHPKSRWMLRARMQSMDDRGMPFTIGYASPVRAGTRDVRIGLGLGEEIHGEVVSPDRLPVAGVPLVATLRTLPMFRSRARTNSRGRFVIRGFHPGFYRISLEDSRHEGAPQVLLGGGHIRSGRTDLRLSLHLAGTISGRLLLASGQPARRSFTLRHETEDREHTVVTNEDGTFARSGLPKGTYLAVYSFTSTQGDVKQVELCRVATGDEDVDIHLPR